MKNQFKQATSYLAFILIVLFAQSCNTQQDAVSNKQETVLSVEAGLVFNSGNVKPVARTEFFLLTRDFESILQDSYFTAELPQNLRIAFSKISPLKAFAFISKSAQRSTGDTELTASRKANLDFALTKALTATKSYAVSQTTTDFQGKAQFKDVKPGEYYLFGYTIVGESAVIWNLRTVVKSGVNSIVLDQNNATTSD